VIVTMSPNNPERASPIQILTEALVPALVGRAVVRVQLSIVAANESEPEPDLAIVPLGDYRHAHPTQAHCIIEVAGLGDAVTLEAFPDVTIPVAKLF
jgi:hypothetical protein